jgi:uncharacterized membrane protein YdjX (TVP38/TMEM64 family)
MSSSISKSQFLGSTHRILRVVGGVALGFLIYYAAYHYASVDCHTMQTINLSAGRHTVAKIAALLIIIASLGIPSAISGIVAGLLLGPTVGGPLASLSIVIASCIFWILGHLAGRNPSLKSSVEGLLSARHWFHEAMKQRSTTGFHWTIANALNAPLSYPFFSFIVGMLIPHLSITSMISGVFAASVLYVAGYALAGGSIGCAVVNHALGLPYDQYRTMMLFSCGILLLLSKLQAHLAQRGKE